MKLHTKPALTPTTIIYSSPSRSSENFFPRFLRNNGENRSCRRTSRSTPMFSSVFRKRNSMETQEPSSPKVTCIGQVRNNKSKSEKPTKTQKASCECQWIQRALFCNSFGRKLKARPKPKWQRWVFSLQSSYQRKLPVFEDSGRKDPIQQQEVEEEEQSGSHQIFVSSPPKNALLLMRCRYEPHRASPIGNHFLVSPSTSRNEDLEEEEARRDEEGEEGQPEERWRAESGSSGGKVTEKKWESGSSYPLNLMRCKSEPMRRTEKLFPEASFWNDNSGRSSGNRLGLAFRGVSQSPHVC